VLNDLEIQRALQTLSGWTRPGNQIEKSFVFAGFPEAIAFVTRLAFAAEAANHHPDIDIRWNRVRVALSTHDARGITALDIDLATVAEGIARGAER
jgi:4a-hydroxytetrahydrobiopterin dehydratase